jgi:hypothetical protein
MRAAVWDRAMKEGVYRISVVVTEVRSVIPSTMSVSSVFALETGVKFLEGVGNSTLRLTSSGSLATTATDTSRGSPVPLDHVSVPKQSGWSWNGTLAMNGTRVV